MDYVKNLQNTIKIEWNMNEYQEVKKDRSESFSEILKVLIQMSPSIEIMVFSYICIAFLCKGLHNLFSFIVQHY